MIKKCRGKKADLVCACVFRILYTPRTCACTEREREASKPWDSIYAIIELDSLHQMSTAEEEEENVLLASAIGQERLRRCVGHAQESIACWKVQSGKTLCGFATLACMSNSIDSSKAAGADVLHDHELLDKAAEAAVIDKSSVERNGITLEEFVEVGASVLPLEKFTSSRGGSTTKDLLISKLSNKEERTRIAVNYHMTTAGQSPWGGHFSPLVAYHEETDSFLVMDTWPETEPFWISWPRLLLATKHHDSKTNLERGFVFMQNQDSNAAQPATVPASEVQSAFEFSASNFRDPKLPAGLEQVDVALELATEENLAEVGARFISSVEEVSCAKGNFEIVKWPVSGWRQLDPDTGDEAGTTEGAFDVHWEGDYFFGHNLGIASSNNYYLDGLACAPEIAQHSPGSGEGSGGGGPVNGDGDSILLWMSDYHPDGGQLFFSENGVPFTVCLGSASAGDDVSPSDMRAFAIPAGKGVYFGPNTWHNGVYTHPSLGPQRFHTRQGRVHARVSCSWAAEKNVLLRVPLYK